MSGRLRTRRRTAREHVDVVYDTNVVNPYGQELVTLLSSDAPVVHVCQPHTARDNPKVDVRAVVAGSRPRNSSLLSRTGYAYIAQRVMAPLRACALALPLDRTLVIAWNRDPIESIIFAVFALARRNVIKIVHNPPAMRPHTNLVMRRAEAVVCAFSRTLVVHSDSHRRSLSRRQARRAQVIPHMPYREWALTWGLREDLGTRSRPVGPTSRQRSDMLYVGYPREDKGRNEMTAILENSVLRGATLRFVGPSGPPGEWLRAAEECGVTILADDEIAFASDEDLAFALSESAVLLAPYVNATQSGSVMMALSCGVGVIAYDSGGLSDIVQPGSLVTRGDRDQFAERVAKYLRSPWASSKFDVDALSEECRAAWKTVTTS